MKNQEIPVRRALKMLSREDLRILCRTIWYSRSKELLEGGIKKAWPEEVGLNLYLDRIYLDHPEEPIPFGEWVEVSFHWRIWFEGPKLDYPGVIRVKFIPHEPQIHQKRDSLISLIQEVSASFEGWPREGLKYFNRYLELISSDAWDRLLKKYHL